MMKCFEDFDVGFFDLIIAGRVAPQHLQEVPRALQYFDALEVGLTATPVRFIERNTYELFGCEERDPTSHFSFDDAIQSKLHSSCLSA
jgi:type I restriction enzyme R subunit